MLRYLCIHVPSDRVIARADVVERVPRSPDVVERVPRSHVVPFCVRSPPCVFRTSLCHAPHIMHACMAHDCAQKPRALSVCFLLSDTLAAP